MLGFLYSIPALQGICMLIVTFDEFETHAGVVVRTFPETRLIILVTQALFNMAVAVGLAPVTGQPLPLISRGGTSTIINCLYMGIILSISRTAKKKEIPQNELDDSKMVAA